MLVLVATLYEFLQFLKIVMWISIPLFLISTLVVVFIHYRRKKRNLLETADEPGLHFAFGGAGLPMGEAPGFMAQLARGSEQYKELQRDLTNIKSSYALLFSAQGGGEGQEDDGKLVLEKQIKQYELKISQLQQAIDYLTVNAGKEDDYEKAKLSIKEKTQEIKRLSSIVEQLHKEIALLTQQNESKNNEIQKLDRLLKSMQESARQASTEARDLQMSFQQQTEDKDKSHFEENKRLLAQLKELNENFKSLEEENRRLLESLNNQQHGMSVGEDMTPLASHDFEKTLLEAREEINSLKNQLVDAESLDEIVKEKKAEIEFLQLQLEQRIRINKGAEQKLQVVESVNVGLQQDLANLRKELIFLQEESGLRLEELKNRDLQIEDGTKENRYLKKQLLEAEDRLVLLEKDQEQSRQKMFEFEKEISQKQELIAGIHQQLTELINVPIKEKNKQSFTASLPHLVEQASI